MAAKTKVGMIGCGNIAPAYVKWCRTFEILDLVACADIDGAKAAALAQEHNLKAMSVPDLLADPDIEIIINLTVPMVHATVSKQILEAGKHVYSEKPLGVERAEGLEIMALAEAKGLRVGCAPDTFLGGGIQTCLKLIEDGVIGEPVAASAFMTGHGPESWHPNPDFFYKFGGGPMFDVGPYYVTTLVALMGPVARISAATRISFPKRVATSKEQYGREIEVEVPTHYSGSLTFASGAIATTIVSFDIWRSNVPRIEIYGSEGTLEVPDPNTFGGTVRVWTTKSQEWQEVPLTHSDDVGRGIGVADMAHALKSGRPHRASGSLAMHVLDVMQAFGESSDSGRAIDLTTSVGQPALLPTGLAPGLLD